MKPSIMRAHTIEHSANVKNKTDQQTTENINKAKVACLKRLTRLIKSLVRLIKKKKEQKLPISRMKERLSLQILQLDLTI